MHDGINVIVGLDCQSPLGREKRWKRGVPMIYEEVSRMRSWSVFILAAASTAGVMAADGIPNRIAGKPDFNGIWQANNTANWDLQTHGARPMVAQPGLTPGSMVLAAPVV